jgi:hypothetical protein
MRNPKRCHSRLLVLDLSRNASARTISKLDSPQKLIDIDFLMRKYPYLHRDMLVKVASVNPTVLIGQDNQTLTGEVVEPDPLGLMITKMNLDWIVHGGYNGDSKRSS